jgi:hypothetical protein
VSEESSPGGDAPYGFKIHTASIVAAGKYDLPTSAGDIKRDLSHERFTDSPSFSLGFDPVCDRIADHLHKRSLNEAKDMSVEAYVATGALKCYVLFQGVGCITHGPFEGNEERSSGYQAQLLGHVP